jgi:molybdopterin converting factor small subunit
MPVSVLIPTPLRTFAEGHRQVEVDGRTVGAALDVLTTRFPRLRAQLFANDALRSFVNVFLNDENIRDVGGAAAPLQGGETLSIIPSIAGG